MVAADGEQSFPAGLLAAPAGVGADEAMLMMAGVELAFVATQVTDRRTGFERRDDRAGVGAAARRDRAGRGADIGAIEVEPDALAERRDVGFREAGIGARDAGLRAGVAFLDAANERAVGRGRRRRMGAEHFFDVHRSHLRAGAAEGPLGPTEIGKGCSAVRARATVRCACGMQRAMKTAPPGPRRTAVGHDPVALPAKLVQQLREIADFTRARGKREVAAVLLTGSGPGKRAAAEALATQLERELLRVDLGSIMSKYIGETEKNLDRVLRQAERAGAVLLLDEAEALFGKRTDVKDSHDRHANVDIAYLLQRLEAHRGLAILTTSRKQNLDPAFVRRLRFVVDFPPRRRAETGS